MRKILDTTGKMSEGIGVQHALGSISSAIERMLSSQEREALGKDGVIRELNEYRNWLKHYCAENSILYVDAEDAAYELIDRAVTNCFAVTGSETAGMERFRIFSGSRYT